MCHGSDAVTNYSPQSAGFQMCLKLSQPVRATDVSRVNTDTQTSADIAIVTADGDRLTLSTASVLQAAYAHYDYQGRLQGQRVNIGVEALQFASSNQVHVVVEGDLDAPELADIRSLLGNLEEMVTEFLDSDFDKAVAQALKSGDLDSIASLDASFRYFQNITVDQRYNAKGSVHQSPVVDLKTVPSPAEPITRNSTEWPLNRMLKAVQKCKDDPEQIAKKMPRFVTRLLKKVANKHGFDAPKHKLASHTWCKAPLTNTPRRYVLHS